MKIGDNGNQVAELQKIHKQEIDDLQDLHKKNLNKNSNSYLNEKRELEANMDSYAKVTTEKTKDAIEQKHNLYRNKIEKEHNNYVSINDNLREDFDHRLNVIKNEYGRSIKNLDDNYDRRLENTTSSLDSMMKERRDNYDHEVGKIAENSKNKVDNMNSEYANEKRELIKHNSIMMEERELHNNLEQGQSNLDNQERVDTIRKYYEKELGNTDLRYQDVLKTLRNNHRTELVNNLGNFDSVTNNAQEENIDFRKKQNILNQSERNKISKMYHHNLQGLRDLAEQRDNVYTNNIKELGSSKDRVALEYSGRLKRFSQEMNNMRFNQQQEKARAQDSYRLSIGDENRSRVKLIEELSEKQNIDNKNLRNKFMEDRDSRIADFSEKFNNMRNSKDDDIYQTRKHFTVRLNNQRKEFGKAVNTLSEQNGRVVKDMQQETGKFKTDLVKKMRQELFLEVEGIKDGLKQKYLQKEHGYLQVISEKDRAIEQSQDRYELKIDNIKKLAIDKLKRQKELAENQRSEDKISYKRSIDVKNDDLRRKLTADKSQMATKLSKVKHLNDIQIGKLTQRYESILSKLKREHKQDMNTKMQAKDRDYKRILKSSQEHMASLQMQFDDKMAKMRLLQK